MNIIDLLSILPFYIEVAIGSNAQDLSFVRVIRLVRVFRIFKLWRNSVGIEILQTTLCNAMVALRVIAFYITLIAMLFGCFIYYAEVGVFYTDVDTFAYHCIFVYKINTKSIQNSHTGGCVHGKF
jgi:hypothetical protein